MDDDEYTPRRRRSVSRRTRGSKGLVVASFLLGIAFILIIFFIYLLVGFGVLFWIFSILFLLVFFIMILVVSRIFRSTRVVRYVERPVEKIVEKPVIRTVEKEVIKYRDRPVVKVQKAIPRSKSFKYVGSTGSKMYHKTSSRLARLIRPKNQVHSNSEAFFIKKGYRASEHIKDDKNEERKKKARKVARAKK